MWRHRVAEVELAHRRVVGKCHWRGKLRLTPHLTIWSVTGAEAGRRGHGWWDRSRESFQKSLSLLGEPTDWSEVCGKLIIV